MNCRVQSQQRGHDIWAIVFLLVVGGGGEGGGGGTDVNGLNWYEDKT